MPPKNKRSPKATSIPDDDPFDGSEPPMMKTMVEMMKWHHRIPPDQLPTFLQEYRILHFVGTEDEYNASDTVYELYHVIFDDHSDRKSLSSCLGMGETLSIWEKEKPTAICAITFLQRENAVLVLFLATRVEYQANGMATFLLSIMHQVVKCRVGVDEVNVYLKANQTANKVAWEYYLRRNFAEMAEGTEAFPKVLRECFADEVGDSPLKDYLGFSNELKWLTICLTRKYFALPPGSRKRKVLKRLFNNPNDNTIDCPSVYAVFPGNLTYEEAEFCKPNYDCYSGEFWDDKAFHPSASIMEKYLFQGPSARLTWIDRCLTRKGDGLSSYFVDIALGWLQRYCKAEIWSILTIIPCKIMTEVSTMESLFTSFIEGRNVISTVTEVKDMQERREFVNHIFHYEIDQKRFMEASILVVEFILQHKELLTKPFIVIPTQDDEDCSWTAFVAVNCGKTGNNENDTKCGYFLFDPTGRRRPSNPPPICRFFLKLVHFVLSPENDPNARARKAKKENKRESSPWKDKVVAPWFFNMHEFYRGFTRQSVNFGCVVTDKKNETCDIEKGRFRPLNLPPDYILLDERYRDMAQSGLKSLIFIRDFCVMVHDVTFDTNGNVKGDITFDSNDNVKGMGRQIPTSRRMFAHYFHDVNVSLFQLIDRIASSNFGSVREGTDEYKKYLRPSKGLERSLSLGGKLTMAEKENAFPDLAKMSGWKPFLKQAVLVGRERDSCERNDVDVAKRLRETSKRLRETSRKPRQTKNKGKKASGEEPSGGLGQRKQDNPSLTKSPARKGESKAVEEQDRPLLVTTSPERIHDNENMPDGAAHTTTALSQGSEFVPWSIDHIAPFISSFKKVFQNAASEDEKKNLCWQVFALSHEKSPLPFVDKMLKFIRDNLEKESESVSIIAKHGKKDVLCGQGQRKCIPYLDRTLDFKNLHMSATNQAEKYEVVRTIYTTLKKEGFRFLEMTGKKEWKEKTYDGGMAYIRWRMKRVCNEKEGEGMTPSINELEAGPGPFQSTSLPPNGIVLRKCDEPHGHPPNMVFRRIIRRAADDTFESETESAKDTIAEKVLEEMQKKGYIFVNKEENVWKGINTEEVRKKVWERVRKSEYYAKQSAVTGKRKAGDDDDAGIIECNKPSKQRMTGSLKAGDDDDACIECNKPSKHSCRKCKKRVCSACCYEKRKLENAWWCNVCFKRQGVRNQTLIRDGNYIASDEE